MIFIFLVLVIFADGSHTQEVPEYDRRAFGSGWADVDRDCQNTRQEELINQSTGPVMFANADECRVIRGRWISIFTNDILTDASTVDIDHVVPLKWAFVNASAYQWTPEKRKAFANDPINLVAVEASLNRSKGAKGIEDWLPPSNECQYVLRFLRILKTYNIDVDEDLSEELKDTQSYACS